MSNLRDYQKIAVKNIYEFFKSDVRKSKICVSTGLGKTAIIVSAIEEIRKEGTDKSIMVLSSQRIVCEQIRTQLYSLIEINIALSVHEYKEQKVLITTYQDILKNPVDLGEFSLVICDEARFVKGKKYEILLKNEQVKFLGILENMEMQNGWFDDAVCIFSYTIKEAIKDGYYEVQDIESNFIHNFFVSLLQYQGYNNIKKEEKIPTRNGFFRADVIAKKEDVTTIIQVKAYRNLYNSQAIINNALKQILQYKFELKQKSGDKKISFIIVLPCEISNDTQKEIFKRFDVVIWDIKNLLYLCGGNRDLIHLLLKSIPYPYLKLEAEKPINFKEEIMEFVPETPTPSFAETYQTKLENCKAGKNNKADKKYEAICTDIIKYLFDTEFFKISEQHKTEDEMFRMDLLCSLKGTTEFWKFLITFYHTKFVVFEYKNYSECIPQNLIYVTEKYLFPVALRNVAFIISRKGFDQNAAKAALGCLRENGKLIISLDDNDLIKMIVMKETGKEPSDYLLDKVEQLLMSVSK